MIVGTKDRRIWIWDLRNCQEPLQKRESSLKYQTRCTTGMLLNSADGAQDVFAVGSIEGASFPLLIQLPNGIWSSSCLFFLKSSFIVFSILLQFFAGRVAIEYISEAPEIQKKKYAFKCHRTKVIDIYAWNWNQVEKNQIFGTNQTFQTHNQQRLRKRFNKNRSLSVKIA